MAYQSQYTEFIFEDYSFDPNTATATFRYSYDGIRHFAETVTFPDIIASYDTPLYELDVLERALQLSFYVVGTSYYKAFPTKKVQFKKAPPNENQASFLQTVYTEGLSQFIFENKLSLTDIAIFESVSATKKPLAYEGAGLLALQSGGKDSLLMTSLLEENQKSYSAMYISSTSSYPDVLNKLQTSPRVVERKIDSQALQLAASEGALNGHVPVTYIVESYALIDAILHNEKTILVSIGAEGGEAHEYIDELAINHQWSKTWEAEQLLAAYIATNISPGLQLGSPLRAYTELKIAELFVKHAWQKFGQTFSSCNRANYQQGADNTALKWCGECPKCANSFLLFSPFVQPEALRALFSNQDLFKKSQLTETFKGLLGIDGVMKPFECIGEVGELRLAYHMAQEKFGSDVYQLPFEVPGSSFDYNKTGAAQVWAPLIFSMN